MNDPVNPCHYRAGDIELIDVIEAFDLDKDAYLCQAFQYIARHKGKGGRRDIEKAVWYLQRWLNRDAQISQRNHTDTEGMEGHGSAGRLQPSRGSAGGHGLQDYNGYDPR